MASSAPLLVKRFSDIYLPGLLSSSEMSAFVARIQNQVITPAQLLMEFHLSKSRDASMGDELTSLFFLILNRPPDYATFVAGKALINQGLSLAQIASLGLSIPGAALNQTQSNKSFVDNLASQLFAQPLLINGLSDLRSNLVHSLNSGQVTRPELLAAAAQYKHPSLKYGDYIDISLLSMATSGTEATWADLEMFGGRSLLPTIKEMLRDAGEIPSGTLPEFTVGLDQSGGSKLTVSGAPIGSLSFDFLNQTSFLRSAKSNQANYKLAYSSDNGETESVTRFKPSLLTAFDVVDLSGLVATGLTNVSIRAHDEGMEVFGASVTNSIEGGGGVDILRGGAGSDMLFASSSRDELFGAGGNDIFVLAPSIRYRNDLSTFTVISDFASGDSISFQRLFGSTSEVLESVPFVVSADISEAQSELLTELNSTGIVLVINSGEWISSAGVLTRASKVQIESLFSETVLTDSSLSPREYVVVSYDPLNGADIWLVSNFTEFPAVTESEIRLIGRILNTSGENLLNALSAEGAFLI